MLIYFTICVISLVVSALTLFSGFGVGTLLLPVFALFFPVQVAIGATAIVHLANNVFKVFLVGRNADLKVMLTFTVPAAIAAVFGALVLAWIGDVPSIAKYSLFGRNFEIEPIKLTIGILIGVFALFEILPAFKRISLPSKFIPVGGLVFGFFGGLSGLQGALRSMFLIRSGLSKEQFIGTTVLSAVIVDISRITVYGLAIFGKHFSILRDQNVLGPVIAGTVAALLGSIVGTRLLKKTTFDTVQHIVGVSLLLIAIALCIGLV